MCAFFDCVYSSAGFCENTDCIDCTNVNDCTHCEYYSKPAAPDYHTEWGCMLKIKNDID